MTTKRINNFSEGIRNIRVTHIIKFEDGTLMATDDINDKWVQSKMELHKHTVISEGDEDWDNLRHLWTNDINRQGTLGAFIADEQWQKDIDSYCKFYTMSCNDEEQEQRAIEQLIDMRRGK